MGQVVLLQVTAEALSAEALTPPRTREYTEQAESSPSEGSHTCRNIWHEERNEDWRLVWVSLLKTLPLLFPLLKNIFGNVLFPVVAHDLSDGL